VEPKENFIRGDVMTVRSVEWPLPRLLRPLCKLARLLEESGEGTLRPPVEAAMGMMGGGVLDNDDPALDSDRVYYYKMDYIRSLSHSTGVIAVSCGRRQRGM